MYIGACTSVATDMYTFGGNDGSTWFNDLSKFDTTNNVWTTIRFKNDETQTPMRKAGCGLVSVNEKTLALFGGWGIDSRLTDEFHLFDIEKGQL